MTIDHLIGKLLLRHNCVIVPSFGGFVAKPISAKVDFDKGIMTPPSKALLFNKQLINNDGLLVNELAQSSSVDFETASIQIKEKVASWNKTLKSGGRIELDKVGHLYLDAEQNICFEQDRFFNLLLESFGLGNIHFLTEEDVKIVEQKQTTISIKENEIAPIQSVNIEEKRVAPIISIDKNSQPSVVPVAIKSRAIIKYLAAACFVPIAFYSIWIPTKTDVLESGVLSLNDFNPFHTIGESEYEFRTLSSKEEINDVDSKSLNSSISELPEEVEVYQYKLDDTNYIPVKIKSNNTSPEVEVEDQGFQPNSMNYIVGCFGDKSNAINLVSSLKEQGLEAKIVDQKGGLYRVSAGSALSVESFKLIESKAKSLGFSGWILK